MHLGSERRAYPRTAYLSDAVVHAANRHLHCKTLDLSAGGLLLMPPARAGAGLPLVIDLTLTDNPEPLRLSGIVVRETAVGQSYAWGVQFTNLNDEVTHRLDFELASNERSDACRKV